MNFFNKITNKISHLKKAKEAPISEEKPYRPILLREFDKLLTLRDDCAGYFERILLSLREKPYLFIHFLTAKSLLLMDSQSKSRIQSFYDSNTLEKNFGHFFNQFLSKLGLSEVSDLGFTFVIEASSKKEFWRASSFAAKEPETNKWLAEELKDDSVFWDIGANIGMYTLFASAIKKDCKILAFEPESQNFATLCRNVYANLPNNIEVYPLAVSGDALSLKDLYISEMAAGAALHNLDAKSPWADHESVFRQKAISVGIDSLVEDFHLPAPTILKIDVDGIELDILKGARRTLKSSVQNLLVEVDANDEKEVSTMNQILSESGFILKSTSDRDSEIHGKLPKNYLWKRK